MPLSTAKLLRTLLVRLGAPLPLALSCLPQDDLSSYSRARTSESEALAPAPQGSDGGAAAPGNGANEPSASPDEGAGVDATLPSDAGGALMPDASLPLDAGPDAGSPDAGGAVPPSGTPLVDGGGSLGPDGDAGS